jgi:hypothetical protein
MKLNEDIPFPRKDGKLMFQWTEEERNYAENGFLCSDVGRLIKQVLSLLLNEMNDMFLTSTR